MKREYILGLVFGLIGIMLIFNINYISYSVYQHNNPDLDLDMANNFLANITIDGDIVIDFKGEIETDSFLEVRIDDENYSIGIEEMLDELSISYEKTEDTKKLVNSSNNKLLTFNKAGNKELGFKLPRNVNLESLSMKITGASYNNVYPKAVTFDFNGFVWQYLGDFNGWNSTFYYLDRLELGGSVRQDTILQDDKKYCVLLNLPFSKDYRIYAEYMGDGSGGDMVASIYSNFNEKIGECILPYPSSVYQWNYCDINLDYSNSGNNLVCIGTNESGGYKLSTTQVNNDETYRCDSYMNCEAISFAAYYIKVQGGNYVFNATSPVIIQEDEDGILLNVVQNSLDNCDYGDDTYCILTFNVGLDTPGRIVLENLRIVYQSIVYNLFYDVLGEESFIHEINGKDMDEVNITFPLSYFNITLDSGIYDLEVSFGGVEEDKRIKISNETNVYGSIESLIGSIENLIEGLESNLILQLLEYSFEDKKSQLNVLKSEFNSLKSSNEAESVKEEKRNQIKIALNTIKDDLNDISIVEPKVIEDRFVAEPEDVNALGFDEDVYVQQDNYDVNFEAKLVEISDSNGLRQYTLVKKIINGRGNYNVYEVIPKNFANDVSIITFNLQPEIIERDPIVKFANVGEVVYFVEGDKVDKVYNTKTIIEPGGPVGDVYGEDICGDGICSPLTEDEESCPEDCEKFKISWIWIIIGSIIIIIGIAYIYFYRGRGDIRKIGKRPIKSSKSLEALVSFISHSNMERDELDKLLLARGWTAEQIKFAFDEVEWRKRKVLVETPEKKRGNEVLIKFIKKNLDAYVPLSRIKSSLLSKGWKEEQINEALKEIK